MGQIFASDSLWDHFTLTSANIRIIFTYPDTRMIVLAILKTARFIRSDKTPEREWRRTDRRTDGSVMAISALCVASNAGAL